MHGFDGRASVGRRDAGVVRTNGCNITWCLDGSLLETARTPHNAETIVV
jgi:hypothetical protein